MAYLPARPTEWQEVDRKLAEEELFRRKEYDKLGTVASFLWDLLDSIDTMTDDITDPSEFRSTVYMIQRRRFEIMTEAQKLRFQVSEKLPWEPS